MPAAHLFKYPFLWWIFCVTQNVDFPAAICLFAVNGAAVSFILFNFVSYPIRSCLNNRKRAKMLSDGDAPFLHWVSFAVHRP